MKIFLIAVVLVAAASADQYWEDRDWIDYRLAAKNRAERAGDSSSTTSTPSSSPKCTQAGPMCHECKDLYLCNSIGGTLVPTFVKDCTLDQSKPHCNVKDCSATPDPYCLNVNFKCSEVEGMYPDPISCNDFHYCVPKASPSEGIELYSSTCGASYRYNYKTTYCDKPLTNQTCPTDLPVPICTTLLQNGALKDNLSIYYVCMEQGTGILYPMLYICENGKTYSGNFNCK